MLSRVHGCLALVALTSALFAYVSIADARTSLPRASQAVQEARVTAPRGQLVEARSVVVRVTSPGNVRKLTARANGKSVSKLFKRTGPRSWAAKLVVGRQLTRGVNHIFFDFRLAGGRKAVGSKRLLVTRSGKPLLRASIVRRGGQYSAHLKQLGKAEVFAVRLNGRSITRLFYKNVRGLQREPISPNEGLRFGVNELEAVAVARSGVITRRVIRFNVDRSHPLAAAGRDRRVRMDQALRLSGARTARLARQTDYEWKIVKKPKGSRAKLRGARGVKPILRPDVNGTYTVQLVTRGGGRAAGRDVTTVKVLPSYPQIGALYDTAVQQIDGSYAVTVGSNCLTNQDNCPQQTYSFNGKPVQLILLDRETMELKQAANLSGSKQDAADVYTLLSLLGNTTDPNPNLFGILAALPGQSVDPGWIGPIQVLTGTNPAIGSTGGWSAIGFPIAGFDEAQQFTTGIVNAGDSTAAQTVLGEQQGFIQFNATTARFQYLAGKYSSYNTSSATTATTNTMRVGDQQFVSPDLTAGCTGGVQIVMLSASTLKPAAGIPANQSFALNCSNQGDEDLGAAMIGNAFNTAFNDPNAATNGPIAIFMQTIGTTPIDTSNPNIDDFLVQIAPQLETMNVNSETFLRAFNTSGTQYALASYTAATSDSLPADRYNASAPTSTSILSGSDGTLDGILRLNHQSHYVARTGTPNTTGGGDLTNIVYQPTTEWPTGTNSSQLGALKYISNKYDIIYEPSSSCYKPKVPDVRFEYCDLDADWGPLLRELPTLKWPGKSACGCSEADWKTMRGVIPDEVNAVKRVYAYVGIIQQIYGGPGNQESLLGLKKIATEVNNIVNPPAKNVISGFWAEVTANILNGLSILPESDTVSDVIQALSTAAFLTEDVLVAPNGQSTLSQIVNTLAGDLPQELETRYLNASEQLGQMGNIIVTDHGKLTAANTSGVLQIDENSLDNLTGSMMVGGYRFAYGRMLGATFNSYALPPSPIPPAPTSPNNYLCNYGLGSQAPFQGIGEDAYVTQTQGVPTLPTFNPISPLWLALGEKGQNPVNNFTMPSQQLLAPLFSPIQFNANGVPTSFGEYKPDWIRRNFTQQNLSCPGN